MLFYMALGRVELGSDGDVTIEFGRNCTIATIHDLLELLVKGELYLTGTLRGHVSQASDDWSPNVPGDTD